MTSWHENETLEEVFAFAKEWATNPDIEIANTLLIHISPESKRDEMLTNYERA